MLKKLVVSYLFLVSIKAELEVPINEMLQLERFENSLYYFGLIYKGNFFQALQFCKYQGMDLLSIETVEENDFLHNHLHSIVPSGDYLFWSSGVKTEPDNRWEWMSTGKPIFYTNWLTGQPSNGATERYLEVRFAYANRGLVFNDQVPTQANFVICEAPAPKTPHL